MSDSLFDNLPDGEYTLEQVVTDSSQVYSRKNLFKCMVDLETQLATISEDIKQLKADFTQSDDNPKGLDKEDVKEVSAYAKKVVADKVNTVIEQGEVFKSLKEEFGA